MTIEKAIEIIKSIVIYDSFESYGDVASRYLALKMAIEALMAIDCIKTVINIDLPIQEDVMRYKTICEIVKGVTNENI